jgi:hypothetical protein
MIEECEGYTKLKKAILDDAKSGLKEEDRLKKLQFAVDRAKHYEEKTGVSASEILTAWEKDRSFWYMNYYQDANQPLIQGESVRVFDTTDHLIESIGKEGFRCPHCNGVTRNPYECKSGVRLPLLNSGKKSQLCNWKVYGLFGSLGKGVYVFVKAELKGENMFMPIAWEKAAELVAV